MIGGEWEGRTLEQVEGVVWPEPDVAATRLVRTVHSLRRKAIGALDVEELRLLLGQREGVGVLVPRALAVLEQNPLAEGDFYPGDLLVATVRIPNGYWACHGDSVVRLRSVIEQVEQLSGPSMFLSRIDEFWDRVGELRSAGLLEA
ncbi:contact-dependent growth inhibition system immunity protein [Nocardia sp. NPDC052566]|uniref:contact-dependent growth inhibition system immunity protein n=1 Tax=Nocardia sp. NPDC052566 TaxID=3364330 RepID=UPI0037CC4E6E